MEWYHWVLVAIGILAIVAAIGFGVLAVLANRFIVRRLDGSGDPDRGVLVYVEPVRWLFIIWGLDLLWLALRWAGWQGQMHLFRWCSIGGGLAVFPDLIARKRLLRRAAELTGRIEALSRDNPGRPIHVVAFSNGCFVALEACRHLRRPGTVGQLVLLAGAVSPTYELDELAGKVEHVHSFWSPLDFTIRLGPLVFGTSERRWTSGCGAVGFRNPPSFVTQRRWRPRDMLRFYFGDHGTIISPLFLVKHVAPIICRAARPVPTGRY